MSCWMSAFEYCSYGFKVFPLVPNAKIPAVSKSQGGNGCLDATDCEEQLSTWARDYPSANIGIACGIMSDLVVIDIDVKKEAGGEETIAEFERSGRIFPKTAEVITPSGGRHLYYTYNPAVNKNSAGKLGKGVDIRSCGGYVVAPPSKIDGNAYRWVRHPSDGIHRLPMWLVITLNPTPRPEKPIQYSGEKKVDGLVRFVEQAPQGERNNRLFWATCRMAEAKNLNRQLLLQAAKNCGLGLTEANKTIQSAVKKVGRQ